MSTASLTIDANQSGTNYTSDLNDALGALNTQNSGSSAPTDNVSTGKLWLDTSSTYPVLKMRYSNGWRSLITVKAGRPDMLIDDVDATTGSISTLDGSTLTYTTGTITTLGCTTLNGATVNTTSDERLKDNIKPIENATETVKQLQGVHYTMNDKENVGVIAQQVETILPEVVHTGEDGYKSVSYGNIVGVLIEAIKEQQEQIEYLKSKLD